MKKQVVIIIITMLLVVALLLSSCDIEFSERNIYVMDTVADIRIYPENEAVILEICDMLSELDGELSAYSGKVQLINDNSGGSLDGHIKELLLKSLELSEKTGGNFSPALGSVIDLWGIGKTNYIPSEDELCDALRSADIGNVCLSDGEIALENGVKLNFGAIAKGYAADIVREMLEQSKVQGAVVSLGGNVYVHGTKPDGSAWNVAIRDPAGDANDWLGSLMLKDKFVITSGEYERYFERDGKKYHHILDPRDGKPAESDLVSASVICGDGAMGDAYSTAIYIMGCDAALEFWRKNENFELVLVRRDGNIIVTEGIEDVFTPTDTGGYSYEIAYR